MKVKICGIRRHEDACVALEAGAWALGFIFHEPSPRYIDPESAGRLAARLPPETLTVGVFVDWPLEELNRAARTAGLGAVQLHGAESPEYARGVEAPMVIKALRVTPDFCPESVLEYPGCRVLLDAYVPGVPGGTGRKVDWRAARQAAKLAPVILAGGIGPESAVEAIENVRPDALDVSSGVESAPGVKDPRKIRRLFEVIRGL